MKVFNRKDLAIAMGLKTGDEIEIKDKGFFVISDGYYLSGKNKGFGFIEKLINVPYKKIEDKRVGDLEFSEKNCYKYKLNILWNNFTEVKTIYEALNEYAEFYDDDEIYSILKSRCDKEVD